MAPPFQRKRQSSHTSITSGSSRPNASRRSTPLIPFKRPTLVAQQQSSRGSTSRPVLPHRRVTIASQPRSIREQSNSQAPVSQADQISAASNVEDGTDESLEHVVMAIDLRERGTLGCAYYVAREERLYCMEDIANGGMETVERLKVDVQPTIVLLSLRVDSGGEEPDAVRIARQSSLVADADDLVHLPYQIEYRPNQEFSHEGAKNKLVNLQSVLSGRADLRFLIPGESFTWDDGQEQDEFGFTSRQGKLLRISGSINLDIRASLGCVGALLTYLQRRRSAEYLQDDPDAQQAYRITSMEMFSLQGTMFINADTLLSLQIIQPEPHPNAFNQGPGFTGSKESLSIYGLFHQLARTPQGRVRLRQYFLRPSLDLEEINTRLDFVSVFVRPDNLIPMQKLSKSMNKVKNMRNTVTLLRKGINGGNQKFGGFKSGVWASLLEFAYHTIDIRDTLQEVSGAEHLSIRASAIDVFDAVQLQRIGRTVHEVVDLDSSIEQHRTIVNRGIDERLDEIKVVYDGMDNVLSKTAIEITRTIPQEIDTSLNVIYFPQLGFHITVPVDELTGQPVYEGGDERWERMFTTRNQVYFKDRRMRDMDDQLGDLYAMICDIEIEISYDLAQRVLEDEKLLIDVSDLCGELDSLLALAQGASQHRLTRPRVTEDNVILIKAGRHLLQEMTVPSYITNDACLAGGKRERHRERSQTVTSESVTTASTSGVSAPSMLLLTGPNYSGKSVYQKSIALAVYLAHIGSFVPCESATIGLTDKILTRITTRETVSKAQSAFMIDLQQIALALNQATRRSLVVIDEFGKGTDSCDGAGLAAGVLTHLLGRGEESPKVLAATHFHEIFELRLLNQQPRLSLAHMRVLVDKRRDTKDPTAEVTYLYALQPGRSALSYGTQCAAMNGIPGPIVARAGRLAELSIQGEDLVSVCAAMREEEEEDLKDAEACARAFLGRDFEDEEGEGMEGEGSEDPRSALESVLGESVSGSVLVS